MKRTIRTVLCAALAMVAAVSCQKSAEVEEPIAEKKGTIEIRIGGLMGEYSQAEGTKSSLVNTVRVSWENGDVVYVYDGTQCLGSLVATLEEKEDRYALLSTDETHTVKTPAEGTTKLTLVHVPSLTEAPAVSEGAISISLAEQNGAKVPFVVFATLDYNAEATIENAVVPFKFATSVIRVNSTGLKASTAISKATLSNVNTSCKLTLSGSAAPTVSGDENGTITRTGDASFAADKVNDEGETVFQIAVPELGSADVRTLTIKQGNSYSKDKKFTTKALNPATSVNTVCQLVFAYELPAGALPGEFSVSNDDGANTKQIFFSRGNLFYEYGSFGFEGNQYYFLGGWDDHLSYFFWSNSADDAMNQTNTGIVSATDILFTNATATTPNNNFTVKVDDTAQSGWRVLSKKEWDYLFNVRPMKYNKDRYTFGIRYSDTPGLVIYPDDYDLEPISGSVSVLPEGVVFLPMPGYYYSASVSNKNSAGFYWASNAGSSGDVYAVLVMSGSLTPNRKTSRNYGSSIRLVKDL